MSLWIKLVLGAAAVYGVVVLVAYLGQRQLMYFPDRTSIEPAKATAFAAPVVESLSVRLLVDSFYDRFIEDAQHPLVKIEHVRHITGRERSTLVLASGIRPGRR